MYVASSVALSFSSDHLKCFETNLVLQESATTKTFFVFPFRFQCLTMFAAFDHYLLIITLLQKGLQNQLCIHGDYEQISLDDLGSFSHQCS